jgi:hypothetical protein
MSSALRFAADATYSSWAGGQRQAWSIAGSNGQVSYTIELDEGADGGTFTLDVVSGATGLEDLDIAFYASFNNVVSSATYMERKTGGESATIPDGSRFAVITMFNGANAAFRFTSYAPVDTAEREKTLKTAPLPAT